MITAKSCLNMHKEEMPGEKVFNFKLEEGLDRQQIPGAMNGALWSPRQAL